MTMLPRQPVVQHILDEIALPEFFRVRRTAEPPRLDDGGIESRLRGGFASGAAAAIKPGMRVSITAGSRGIARIDFILRTIAAEVKRLGARPFIVACMGSHGGDAAGQEKILRQLGITEERIGAPVVASDELVSVGRARDGRTVYADAFAAGSDALLVVNRIKPHTAFHAPVESGLQKMLAIGLGKQKGADACHVRGFDGMYGNVTDFADVILRALPVAAGVGILENAFGEVFDLAVVPGNEIREREPELLERARGLMPRLMFDDIDLLVVEEMGKDVSGSGMDTNVIGRYPTPGMTGGPRVAKIVVLGLTEKSEGNAHGVGFADFVSMKLFRRMIPDKTYPNCLTNKVVAPAKMPPVMPNDLYAVKAAVKTCPNQDPDKIRAVWIKNTKYLQTFYVSKCLAGGLGDSADCVVEKNWKGPEFTRNGTLKKGLWDDPGE